MCVAVRVLLCFTGQFVWILYDCNNTLQNGSLQSADRMAADGGWQMADRKMRMIKCGWKNADDKMRMKNCQ